MNNIIEVQIKNNVIVINREQKGKISVQKKIRIGIEILWYVEEYALNRIKRQNKWYFFKRLSK